MICAEADAYWCLCKLLDGIQDHYTHAQPGIQRTVFRLEELVRSVCIGHRKCDTDTCVLLDLVRVWLVQWGCQVQQCGLIIFSSW